MRKSPGRTYSILAPPPPARAQQTPTPAYVSEAFGGGRDRRPLAQQTPPPVDVPEAIGGGRDRWPDHTTLSTVARR